LSSVCVKRSNYILRIPGVDSRELRGGDPLESEIFSAIQDAGACILNAWSATAGKTQRRFSVEVDQRVAHGSDEKVAADAREAATLLLGLPWELLHNDQAYLFQGARPVRVRRRLPNTLNLGAAAVDLPIRILLVSPRREDDSAGYIDHRASALSLVQALEALGSQIELTVLRPPTLPAFREELDRARETDKPYHVVHFDGHGVFSKKIGLGGLCFEDTDDEKKLEQRHSKIIYTDELGAILTDHRIPLFFLEACQSAQADKDPTASVAASLLLKGVTSVVAMSHSVLVEAARRFVEAF
jgi:hypothetical protein